MKLQDLPSHLVLFYLWRAAQPNVVAVNHDPRRIRCAADVQWYMEQQKGREKRFAYLDGRPLFLTIGRGKVSTRDYAAYNGEGVAEKAFELLCLALDFFVEEFGSREEALRHLTETEPQNLDIQVTREYPRGRALFDAFCPGEPIRGDLHG